MLLAWNEGVTGLRGKRVYSLQEWNPSSAFEGFSDPTSHSNEKAVIGRSEGLARRS
jgi:serine/threonine-protein kinase HipA